MLEQLAGAAVIDADAVTHALQQPGAEGLRRIAAEFGPDVLAPDSTLDRSRLAARVFSDPAELARLNALMHPLIRAEEIRLLELHRDATLRVLVVPLLFENGVDALTDETVVVTVDEDARRARLFARSGMTPDEVARRLARQMPQEEKIRRADHIIDNGGTLDATRAQVRRLLENLGIPLAPRE